MGGNLRAQTIGRTVSLGASNPLPGNCQNLIAYRINVRSHAIILEADYVKTESAQLRGAQDVAFTAAMLAAVNFDNQVGF